VPHDGKSPVIAWDAQARHEDNEVSVEFRAADPNAGHNAALAVGMVEEETAIASFRIHCNYTPERPGYAITLWNVRAECTQLATAWVPVQPTADGFHRLSMQVRGTALRGQMDDHPPIEAQAPIPVRGRVGLIIGLTDLPSVSVQFRNLRIDPLPAARPSEEEAAAAALTELQESITKSVEEANLLAAAKQPEAAALMLRATLADVDELPAGILRDNLGKSITETLQKFDPNAKKRLKVAQTVAAELTALADSYAGAGMARAARALVRKAVSFDEGQAPRLAAAEEAVAAWNKAQATVRAAELAPPADDGALLREWFAEGRLLDSRDPKWVVEGPSARSELGPRALTAWLPKQGSPKLTKARVHVHLPARGSGAGFCFDSTGPGDYAIACLVRGRSGLSFHSSRYANGRWSLLKKAEIPLDAWRLDGWFPIELEANEKGLLIRAAGAEVQLEKKQLPNGTGNFGLLALNDATEPAVIELRAFQFGP
jgi:hypothetical protein